MTKEELARELAEIDDPTTWSTEGLDDECFFCQSPKQSVYIKPDFEYYADHRKSCLWVRARQSFGMDLGRNIVKGS